MIARHVIDGWFADHRARGIAVDGDLRWGFSFLDRRRDALERFSHVLAAGGYRVAGIVEAHDGQLALHVDRVERHDELSLYERCQELSALAANHRIAKFGGFELVP